MQEIWEVIRDDMVYEGEYEVSTLGSVRRTKDGSLLPIQDNGAGYKKCALNSVKGKSLQMYIHRLVAKAFLPNTGNLPQVGHKDHNKENNCVDNLYWTTQSQNTRDGIKAGRINNQKRPNSQRFSHSDISFIAEKHVRGYGVAEIARLLDVPRTSVSSVLNARSNWALFCSEKSRFEQAVEQELAQSG